MKKSLCIRLHKQSIIYLKFIVTLIDNKGREQYHNFSKTPLPKGSTLLGCFFVKRLKRCLVLDPCLLNYSSLICLIRLFFMQGCLFESKPSRAKP